jgi:hypothetical protein
MWKISGAFDNLFLMLAGLFYKGVDQQFKYAMGNNNLKPGTVPNRPDVIDKSFNNVFWFWLLGH